MPESVPRGSRGGRPSAHPRSTALPPGAAGQVVAQEELPGRLHRLLTERIPVGAGRDLPGIGPARMLADVGDVARFPDRRCQAHVPGQQAGEGLADTGPAGPLPTPTSVPHQSFIKKHDILLTPGHPRNSLAFVPNSQLRSPRVGPARGPGALRPAVANVPPSRGRPDHRLSTEEMRQPVRLATIRTSEGSRLHVRGRSGYLDVATEVRQAGAGHAQWPARRRGAAALTWPRADIPRWPRIRRRRPGRRRPAAQSGDVRGSELLRACDGGRPGRQPDAGPSPSCAARRACLPLCRSGRPALSCRIRLRR